VLPDVVFSRLGLTNVFIDCPFYIRAVQCSKAQLIWEGYKAIFYVYSNIRLQKFLKV